MHIEHWSINRVLRLPDWMFGRRFEIGVSFLIEQEQIYYDICEIPLPNLCVIWELSIWVPDGISSDSFLRLALGDHLPGAQTEFEVMEPVFQSIGSPTVGPRRIWLSSAGQWGVNTLRKVIEPQGRRLVGEVENNGSGTGNVMAILIVSSIPREIPEWMVSGVPKNLL